METAGKSIAQEFLSYGSHNNSENILKICIEWSNRTKLRYIGYGAYVVKTCAAKEICVLFEGGVNTGNHYSWLWSINSQRGFAGGVSLSITLEFSHVMNEWISYQEFKKSKQPTHLRPISIIIISWMKI